MTEMIDSSCVAVSMIIDCYMAKYIISELLGVEFPPKVSDSPEASDKLYLS